MARILLPFLAVFFRLLVFGSEMSHFGICWNEYRDKSTSSAHNHTQTQHILYWIFKLSELIYAFVGCSSNEFTITQTSKTYWTLVCVRVFVSIVVLSFYLSQKCAHLWDTQMLVQQRIRWTITGNTINEHRQQRLHADHYENVFIRQQTEKEKKKISLFPQ